MIQRDAVARDPGYRRVLLRGKGNIGHDPGALEFRIVGRSFRHDDGIVQEREVVVDVHPSSITKRDLLEREIQRKQSKIEIAMDVIRRALSSGDWVEASSVRERLEAEEINSNNTINEATKRLGVVKEKRGFKPAT